MEKEICEAIRKHIQPWRVETDEFIMEYCSLYHNIQEMICNKGYSIEEAIQTLITV